MEVHTEDVLHARPQFPVFVPLPPWPSPLRGAGADPPLFRRCSVIVGLEIGLLTEFREISHSQYSENALIINH